MPFNMETITLHHSQDDPAAAAAAAAAEKEINVSWKDVKYQILSSNVAFLFTIHAGVNLAFSNFLLNDLDKDASSWFASLGAAGTPIGAISCGPLMDAVGRKGCNLVIALPCVAAWLILSVVDQRWSAISLWLLYLSRFLGGIAAGLTTANLVYVSETSHKKYRATFLSLVGLYFSFGILLTTLLKLVFTWKQSAVFFAVFFSIVALLVSRLTPESPVWLANFRHDPRAARKSLLALNSNSQIFEREWRDLMANAFSSSPPGTKRQNSGGGRSWFEPAVYKPTATLLALILAQQLSGLYATVYYAYDIFTRLAPQKGSAVAREAFVLFGVVRFAASLVSCCVSAKVGRRKLLIASAAGMMLALVGVIVALLSSSWLRHRTGSAAAEYAAISCFVLYVGVGAVGVMTVPWTLIVELLPTEKRASAGAALVSYAYLLIFALVKTLPFALDRVDVTLAFAFFALVSSLIVVFVYFFIPETLNRTLLEIESFYSGLVPVNAAGANFDECADDATKTTAITGDANETVCPAAEAPYRSLLGANP